MSVGSGSIQSAAAVYLDHAATTPLRPGVLEAMLPYFTERFGNPSALYATGRVARAALDTARDTMADLLGCRPAEIYFTAGGTEAINMALKGYARSHRDQGQHILISAVEHHAVLAAAQYLATEGFTVETIPVDNTGLVTVDAVQERIRRDTVLVAVMHANNEVGTIQPVADIAELCKERDIAMLADAVQTAGHLRLDNLLAQAAFIAVSAHKFGGPKGVGVLVARRDWRFQPILHGGGQEREKRAGTENVPGIVGMAAALEKAVAAMPDETARISALAAQLRIGLAGIPDVHFSGHPTERLPGCVHVCFAGVDGESLLLNLDRAGVAASSGSACSTGSTQVSHVLLAMGVPREIAAGALRFTLGHTSTASDVERVLQVLPPIVERLRHR